MRFFNIYECLVVLSNSSTPTEHGCSLFFLMYIKSDRLILSTFKSWFSISLVEYSHLRELFVPVVCNISDLLSIFGVLAYPIQRKWIIFVDSELLNFLLIYIKCLSLGLPSRYIERNPSSKVIFISTNS